MFYKSRVYYSYFLLSLFDVVGHLKVSLKSPVRLIKTNIHISREIVLITSYFSFKMKVIQLEGIFERSQILPFDSNGNTFI